MKIKALHKNGVLNLNSYGFTDGKDGFDEDLSRINPGQEVIIDNKYIEDEKFKGFVESGVLTIINYVEKEKKDNNDEGEILENSKIDSEVNLIASDIEINNGETKIVDRVKLNEYRAAKWFVNICDNSNSTYKSMEIFAQHDGVNVEMNEFGTLGSASVNLSVDVMSGEMRLRATASEDDQVVKTERISI